ncbi:MAG: aldehyde dehydrogenase family protein [Cloacibacillus evryensis]
MDKKTLTAKLGVDGLCKGASTGIKWFASEKTKKLVSYSPVDNQPLGSIQCADAGDYERVMTAAEEAFLKWRAVPAPVRGEIVRKIALRIRENKENLGSLVSMEMGKILQEGMGEVQEMIDICDFAVGLSRQLYGLTMPSERPEHRLMEQWHPLGPITVISAYNFPIAVWSWNAMIAAVCGDVVIWKPSSKTPLCAIAVQKIVAEVMEENGMPEGATIIGWPRRRRDHAEDTAPASSPSPAPPGSGVVGETVAKHFGRAILELGGNNAPSSRNTPTFRRHTRIVSARWARPGSAAPASPRHRAREQYEGSPPAGRVGADDRIRLKTGSTAPWTPAAEDYVKAVKSRPGGELLYGGGLLPDLAHATRRRSQNER